MKRLSENGHVNVRLIQNHQNTWGSLGPRIEQRGAQYSYRIAQVQVKSQAQRRLFYFVYDRISAPALGPFNSRAAL